MSTSPKLATPARTLRSSIRVAYTIRKPIGLVAASSDEATDGALTTRLLKIRYDYHSVLGAKAPLRLEIWSSTVWGCIWTC